MRRSMFQMGFNSPTASYEPQMGNLLDDAKKFLTNVQKPANPAPVAVPAPPTTILGMDQNTVLIGGAALLGVGLLIAIIAGRKAAQPTTAPARKK